MEIAESFLSFAERLSGANVLTIVLLLAFLGGYLVYLWAGKQVKFAKKCGVQKQLLVGHVQDKYELDPSEALIKTNQMTKAALNDS